MISYDGVKHCLLSAVDWLPPRLDLARYPHLPPAEVTIVSEPVLLRIGEPELLRTGV